MLKVCLEKKVSKLWERKRKKSIKIRENKYSCGCVHLNNEEDTESKVIGGE